VTGLELRSGNAARGPIDVVDLFCGCGGLSVGFEVVGRARPSYRLAGAVDIDEHSCSTYEANLGVRPLCADIQVAARRTEGIRDLCSRFQLRAGAPLVLLGGPPCQGFSAHQKKAGHPDDERNDLVSAFARFVQILQPDVVVFENVPELLAKKFWHHFVRVRGILERSGYTVRAQIRNLAEFGVPQERFRAVTVAMKGQLAMPAPFLDRSAYRTVRNAIGHLPPINPGERSAHDSMHFCTRHHPKTVETIRRVPLDGGKRPHGVGPRCLDRVDGFRDVYGRLYWDRPANTITAYARNPASGRYVHPAQHRGLTIREAALLQSFPSDYSFSGPFDDRFIQIGNAVPPAFSTFLAAHLLGEIGATSELITRFDHVADIREPTSNSFSSGIAGRKRGGKSASSKVVSH
jgi:DNA (cytosine-5)-methyltransferase 1